MSDLPTSPQAAAWLRLLAPVEPPVELKGRILASLPARAPRLLRWADDVRPPRRAGPVVRRIGAAAAAVLLTLGIGAVAWSASRAEAGDAPVSQGFRSARVVDDPSLVAFQGAEGFDPLAPWAQSASWGPGAGAGGEPVGGP